MNHSPKILFVDDDQDILDFFDHLFDMYGLENSLAHNSSEALQLVEAEEFDIVITDYKMPGMDGVRLCGMIKEKNPDIPIIIASASDSGALRAQARENMADLVVRKPLDYIELLADIEKLLAK